MSRIFFILLRFTIVPTVDYYTKLSFGPPTYQEFTFAPHVFVSFIPLGSSSVIIQTSKLQNGFRQRMVLSSKTLRPRFPLLVSEVLILRSYSGYTVYYVYVQCTVTYLMVSRGAQRFRDG